MKWLIIFAVVGLHQTLPLTAFTANVCKFHDETNRVYIRKMFSSTVTSRIPSVIYGALDNNGDDWENSTRFNGSVNKIVTKGAIISTIAGIFIPLVALGVSGGGLDYANLDISGQDFSGGNYKGKDFTQVIAKATNFAGSNLQGCRFYKAYLVRADFTNADLRGASLEDTSMDEASLRNTIASGAYFSNSVMDAKDLENADFTDAQFPSKTLALLCQREDVKGTNPTTGADTRESLMCP